MLNYISIRSKLLILILSLGIFMAIGIALIAYQIGQSAMERGAFAQLTAVRDAKKHEVENYFKDTVIDFSLMATDPEVSEAMSEFVAVWNEMDGALPEGKPGLDALRDKYENTFFVELAEKGASSGTPQVERYMPTDPRAQLLQIAFWANNPAEWGEKYDFMVGGYDEAYDAVHLEWHERLLELTDARNYEDLFLIDPDGHIIYSAYKESDFADNVTSGILSRTSLNAAFVRASSIGNDGEVVIEDFTPYPPNYFAPSAFMAAPVFKDGNYIGVIATQLPIDDVDDTMTGSRQWEEHGLGETGETYLVAPDRRMRSTSRFLVEDKSGYLEAMRRIGVQDTDLRQIDQSDSSILVQPADTPAIDAAFRGDDGTLIVEDYRGVKVLSAYSLINAGGLRWAILSEIDAEEAFRPITSFRNQMLIATTGAAIFLALLALWLAGSILKPIERLATAAELLASGERGVRVPEKGTDEFAVLGRRFNSMATELENRADNVRQQADAYETMLRSIFPEMIADRLGAGDRVIAETHEDVSVIIVLIDGIEQLMVDRTADETLRLLNDLVGSFDSAAEKAGVDKVKTLGEIYVGVCSLTGQRVDHVRRSLNAAASFHQIATRFENQHGFRLSLRIGIASGEIDGGIVGTQRLVYDVWGLPVAAARRAAELAGQDAIGITEASLQQVNGPDVSKAEAMPDIHLGGDGEIAEKAFKLKLTSPSPNKARVRGSKS